VTVDAWFTLSSAVKQSGDQIMQQLPGDFRSTALQAKPAHALQCLSIEQTEPPTCNTVTANSNT